MALIKCPECNALMFFKEVENHLFYYAELLSEYMKMDIYSCRVLTKKGFKSNDFIKKLINHELPYRENGTRMERAIRRGTLSNSTPKRN